MAITPDPQHVELAGITYVILRQDAFAALCEQAGIAPLPISGEERVTLDRESLARRLTERRRTVNLTQKALAELAGVRVETLNRIERGKTNPDFATIRKLVTAIDQAERDQNHGDTP